MSNFKLNLPTEIPWERICVTEDMIDRNICDSRFPAKWQTSMAVYKYVPEEEYQLYPKYRITYLKVTATITGYQPLNKEIQGHIDWDGINVETIPGITELLNSYNPCHGAILQVAVAPHQTDNVAPADYPFFLDFEPKKRDLYEMATDTSEKQSRSIESLSIGKSAGQTSSMEILDVDMGGGGFGAQASYAGTGGGFSYSAPNGQWGTKRLNGEESMSARTTDTAQERRETESFTTHLTQMYHLLDSYHVGTNRAVFFVQPRPHTLEEPSGFVRGPRPVEGIQEFFLVVAQPKDHEDFCVSLRLDTSHLTKTAIMDYERKSVASGIAQATAPVATEHDIPAENIVGARACFFSCWDVHYQCYRTEANDTETFSAPSGYRIEGYNDLIKEEQHGSTLVTITPNGQTLNINAHAEGHRCYEGSEVCVDCPDEIQEWSGRARRQVQINLVSLEKTKKVGEEEVLMITTRGLCCCANGPDIERFREKVVGIHAIPADLLVSRATRRALSSTTRLTSAAHAGAIEAVSGAALRSADHEHDGPCTECAEKMSGLVPATAAADTIRTANALSDYMRVQALRSLNDPYARPVDFIETDFFAKELEAHAAQTKAGRKLLAAPASRRLSNAAVTRVAEAIGRDPKKLTMREVMMLRGNELEKVANLSSGEVNRLRLEALGVKFVTEPASKADKATTKTTKATKATAKKANPSGGKPETSA
jgi:hypothetical protein